MFLSLSYRDSLIGFLNQGNISAKIGKKIRLRVTLHVLLPVGVNFVLHENHRGSPLNSRTTLVELLLLFEIQEFSHA